MTLSLKKRFKFHLQVTAGWLLYLPLVAVISYLFYNVYRYRIHDITKVRARYRALLQEHDHIIICPNHLTMFDSIVLAFAFGSPLYYFFHFRKLAWNIPARENFGSSIFRRIVTYLGKCIQIEREGGDEHINDVLATATYALARKHPVLIFPEGERSRTARVELDNIKYGIGRIIEHFNTNEGKNVAALCVYARGDKQKTYSDTPQSEDNFRISMQVIHPHSNKKGMRAHRELARQVGRTLIEMEDNYWSLRNVS